ETLVSVGVAELRYFGLGERGPTIYGYVDTLTLHFAATYFACVLAWRTLRGRDALTPRDALLGAPRAYLANLLTQLVTVLGFAACILPGLYASLVFYAVLPVALVERKIGGALGRSRMLMEPYAGPMIVAFLLTTVPHVLCLLLLARVNADVHLFGRAT